MDFKDYAHHGGMHGTRSIPEELKESIGKLSGIHRESLKATIGKALRNPWRKPLGIYIGKALRKQ